jgi:hypothetical protein
VEVGLLVARLLTAAGAVVSLPPEGV